MSGRSTGCPSCSSENDKRAGKTHHTIVTGSLPLQSVVSHGSSTSLLISDRDRRSIFCTLPHLPSIDAQMSHGIISRGILDINGQDHVRYNACSDPLGRFYGDTSHEYVPFPETHVFSELINCMGGGFIKDPGEKFSAKLYHFMKQTLEGEAKGKDVNMRQLAAALKTQQAALEVCYNVMWLDSLDIWVLHFINNHDYFPLLAPNTDWC